MTPPPDNADAAAEKIVSGIWFDRDSTQRTADEVRDIIAAALRNFRKEADDEIERLQVALKDHNKAIETIRLEEARSAALGEAAKTFDYELELLQSQYKASGGVAVKRDLDICQRHQDKIRSLMKKGEGK